MIGQKVKGNKYILTLGIAFNIIFLSYFKYSSLFFSDLLGFSHEDFFVYEKSNLPLGISFYTFSQIAYLYDVYRQKGGIEHDVKKYALFVSWFPHLIAGPLLHHRQMMPQFLEKKTVFDLNTLFLPGVQIFLFGLFKKVMLADNLTRYVDPVFTAAANHQHFCFIEGWLGLTAYALQLYFDFSGYSEMAIGISYIFGIKLPLNFNAPYQATNIIDFWRRWHISLSLFLRDYLYIPLGGNKFGRARKLFNIFLTMALGGLWHGAGLTFLVWGALHGLFLTINHLWREFSSSFQIASSALTTFISRSLTLFSIFIAWVYFRSTDITAAHFYLKNIIFNPDFSVPSCLKPFASWVEMLTPLKINYTTNYTFTSKIALIEVGALLLATLFSIPVIRLFNNFRLYLSERELESSSINWRPTNSWAAVSAAIIVVIIFSYNKPSIFCYSQF